MGQDANAFETIEQFRCGRRSRTLLKLAKRRTALVPIVDRMPVDNVSAAWRRLRCRRCGQGLGQYCPRRSKRFFARRHMIDDYLQRADLKRAFPAISTGEIQDAGLDVGRSVLVSSIRHE